MEKSIIGFMKDFLGFNHREKSVIGLMKDFLGFLSP
jgi:hypothetical protein